MIKDIIIKDLKEAWKKLGFEYSDKYYVEVPKNPEFGDFSTNAALVNARRNSMNSKEMAQKVANYLSRKKSYKSVKIAGNGFINFEIANNIYYKALLEIASHGSYYGAGNYGKERKVLIEFVSANPTGPLNVVNARAAAFGDILYRVMNYAGFQAKREFYINDAGNQVDVLAESLEMRYREVIGERIDDLPEGTYQGEYIIDLALKLKAREGSKIMHYSEADKLEKMKEFALEEIHLMQRESLERFGVEFDSWVSEKILRTQGVIEEVLSYLAEADCTYESEDAIWFASSKFGDEKDRVLMKSDGEITYFVPDLAYHLTKYHRGFDYMIDVLGPDHHGYVPRLRAAIRALNFDENKLEIVFLQQVNLFEGGEKVKMSKRTGNIITMDELIEEVGVDAARFFFLEKKPSAHLNFDLELAKKKTSENPVYYCQYAHARICSVLKKAKKEKINLKGFQEAELKKLKQDEELVIIKKLLDFPDLIVGIAEYREPHRLAFYIYDLASLFHKYYQKYQIVNPEYPELSRARLFLITAIKEVLSISFRLMGISAPEKMTRKETPEKARTKKDESAKSGKPQRIKDAAKDKNEKKKSPPITEKKKQQDKTITSKPTKEATKDTKKVLKKSKEKPAPKDQTGSDKAKAQPKVSTQKTKDKSTQKKVVPIVEKKKDSIKKQKQATQKESTNIDKKLKASIEQKPIISKKSKSIKTQPKSAPQKAATTTTTTSKKSEKRVAPKEEKIMQTNLKKKASTKKVHLAKVPIDKKQKTGSKKVSKKATPTKKK